MPVVFSLVLACIELAQVLFAEKQVYEIKCMKVNIENKYNHGKLTKSKHRLYINFSCFKTVI